MKILHIADWHLGKKLGDFSRIEEQKEVLEEICEIVEQEMVDVVLIAGDVFDNPNPPNEAIALFYRTVERLSCNGTRLVFAIAGNHDSPDRLANADSLARSKGIFLLGDPENFDTCDLELGSWQIKSEKAGLFHVFNLEKKQKLNLIWTPFVNEQRLKMFLGNEDREKQMRETLAEHWQSLAQNLESDSQTINILMTHLFVINRHESEEESFSDDEKPIAFVGGAQAIYADNFPKNLDYVALGHIHLAKNVASNPYPIRYCGSCLSYSMSEAMQEKSVTLLQKENSFEMRHLPLKSGRSLIKKHFENLDDCLEFLNANQESFLDITLRVDEFLSQENYRLILKTHPRIISFMPVSDLISSDEKRDELLALDLSRSIEDLFTDFFTEEHGQAPNAEIKEIFREINSMNEKN
jgi:exonuclease SbcD